MNPLAEDLHEISCLIFSENQYAADVIGALRVKSQSNFSPDCSVSTMAYKHLGPVVQSIVSLTSSLRGQLVKCFTTL